MDIFELVGELEQGAVVKVGAAIQIFDTMHGLDDDDWDRLEEGTPIYDAEVERLTGHIKELIPGVSEVELAVFELGYSIGLLVERVTEIDPLSDSTAS